MHLMHYYGMQPATRRTIILDLLHKGPIPTQQDLATQLSALGVTATQTTLSRDLAAIGAVKTVAGYHAPDASIGGNSTAATTDLGDLVLNAEIGTQLLVLRTPSAHAHPVAQRIDALDDPDILGTIAGEDTVFVAVRTPAAARRLAKLLAPYSSRSRRS